MTPPIVVLSAVRTPWCRQMGSLSDLSGPDLGALAIRGALERAGISSSELGAVVVGNLHTHADPGGPAWAALRGLEIRDGVVPIALRAGCASGLAAAALAAASIAAGGSEVALAAGFESSSQAPHLALGLRRGLRLGGGALLDPLGRDRSEWSGSEPPPREEPDRAGGPAGQEIVTVDRPKPPRGQPGRVEADEPPTPRGEGSGSAARLADGAAALVLASESWARSRGLSPLCGLAPERLPLPEASGAAAIEADLPGGSLQRLRDTLGAAGTGKLNGSGGPQAMGHAAGADGARLLVSLVHDLLSRGGGSGFALAADPSGREIAMRAET